MFITHPLPPPPLINPLHPPYHCTPKCAFQCPPPPQRRHLISLPCLESQGVHFIPHSCLMFFCQVLLLFLSCHFLLMIHFADFSPRQCSVLLLLRVKLFLYGSCYFLLMVHFSDFSPRQCSVLLLLRVKLFMYGSCYFLLMVHFSDLSPRQCSVLLLLRVKVFLYGSCYFLLMVHFSDFSPDSALFCCCYELSFLCMALVIFC